MNSIDKNIFKNYETVENAFNNDLRAFYANGRTMKARALKGTSYYFRSGKTHKKYDISPEECRILNLFYNTLNTLNKAQDVDNMMAYYNGNVWWFERAELRRKVIEMVNSYIDAFEAWLNEKDDEKNGEETEKVKTEETEVSGENGEEKEDTCVCKIETQPQDQEADDFICKMHTKPTSSTAPRTTKTETEMVEKTKRCVTPVVEYKLIEGFDDYMVSSDGKVWSLNYSRTGKMKELKPIPGRGGYLRVDLWTNGQMAHKLVHRLVAEAFVANPYNRPEVNHIDEVKTNNCVENLEWCTVEYNRNYGTRNARSAKARTNHKTLSTPVVCLETGEVYPSVHEAERQTGINQSNITKCLNGKLKTTGGFHWGKFIEGDNPIYE